MSKSKIQVAEAKKEGRPTKYDPELLPQVLELASRNQPDAVIAARVFGCAREVLVGWKSKYPNLANTIKRGKAEYYDTATAEVEDALFRNAKGECIIERWTDKDGQEHERFAPPNTAAQIFWLINDARRKAAASSDKTVILEWQQTQQFEHSGEVKLSGGIAEAVLRANGDLSGKAGA